MSEAEEYHPHFRRVAVLRPWGPEWMSLRHQPRQPPERAGPLGNLLRYKIEGLKSLLRKQVAINRRAGTRLRDSKAAGSESAPRRAARIKNPRAVRSGSTNRQHRARNNIPCIHGLADLHVGYDF